MDDKAAIRQDSFRNRQVSVNQIITIEKMNDEKPLHGWLLYMDGDQGIHPQYVQLYRDACKRCGMSICLGWYQPDLLCEKDAVRQLKNQIAGDGPSFVINRTRDYRLAKLLEVLGVTVYNSSQLARAGNDKSTAYRWMQKLGVPMMPTLFHIQPSLPWYPAVVKSCTGHGGTEVFLIRDELAWREWNMQRNQAEKTDHRLKKQYVIQKAASDLGRDVRVYVVGNRITAAVLRTSGTDFRSNYCLGGSVELYHLTEAEHRLTERVMAQFSIGMAGIDFIFHNGSMVFNEIEDVAGARGLYSLTDYDIVDDYIGYIKEECIHDANADKIKDL